MSTKDDAIKQGAKVDRAVKAARDALATAADATLKAVSESAVMATVLAELPVGNEPPTDARPTVGTLREYIRAKFIALTKLNGYDGGRVPGEDPVGTVVDTGGADTAVDEWIAQAKADYFVGDRSNADAYAMLDAAIIFDVKKYYPGEATDPTIPTDPDPTDPTGPNPSGVDGWTVAMIKDRMRGSRYDNTTDPNDGAPDPIIAMPGWGTGYMGAQANFDSSPPIHSSSRSRIQAWGMITEDAFLNNDSRNYGPAIDRFVFAVLWDDGSELGKWEVIMDRTPMGRNGNMVANRGLLSGPDPDYATAVDGSLVVRGIGQGSNEDRSYHWYPDTQSRDFGAGFHGVRGFFVGYETHAAKIDANGAEDFDADGCLGYAGFDRYPNPLEDGGCSRFIRIAREPKVIAVWSGTIAEIEANPPPFFD